MRIKRKMLTNSSAGIESQMTCAIIIYPVFRKSYSMWTGKALLQRKHRNRQKMSRMIVWNQRVRIPTTRYQFHGLNVNPPDVWNYLQSTNGLALKTTLFIIGFNNPRASTKRASDVGDRLC